MNTIIPPRKIESDEEQRLREALNRHLGAALDTLDSAIRLRTAPNDAKRLRHLMRGDLLRAGQMGMDAHALSSQTED